jgi:hypothetical protein
MPKRNSEGALLFLTLVATLVATSCTLDRRFIPARWRGEGRLECSFAREKDVLSPDGAYHAIAGAQTCTYNGKPFEVETEVIVAGLEDYSSDSETVRGRPYGSKVFAARQSLMGSPKQAISGNTLTLTWQGSLELTVGYPRSTSFACIQPGHTFQVHCVEDVK